MLKIINKQKQTVAYLNNVSDIQVREKINGEYTLKFKGNVEELKTEFLYDRENLLEINNDYFRVVSITDERDASGICFVDCTAEHISYDLLSTQFENFVYVYKDLTTVMLKCLENTDFQFAGTDITLKTDIQYEQETNAKAISIAIANNWKGELKYFQNQISVWQRRGADRGGQFRLGKNLKSVRRTVDWKEKDEEGNPKVSYEIDILDLREQEGYEDLEYFELGDTVKVIDELLNIEITARIIEWEYNPLRREDTKIKLGDELSDIRGSLSGINQAKKSIAEVKKRIDESATDWDKIKNITDNLGNVIAEKLAGSIDTSNNLVSNATGTVKMDSQGLLIHDQPTEQASTWAMRLNSTGFQIANGKNPDGSWNWRTFGTGAGFTADEIVAGVLKAINIQGVHITGSEVTGGKIKGAEIEGGSIRIGTSNYMLKIDSSGNIRVFSKTSGVEKDILRIESIDEAAGFKFFNHGVDIGQIAIAGMGTSKQFNIGTYGTSIPFYISTSGETKIISSEKVEIRSTSDVELHASDGLSLYGRNYVTANKLVVSGSKNAIVPTKHFGDRLMYAYEMDKSKFATEGAAYIKNWKCRIDLDPIFLETIEKNNHNSKYQIQLTPCGKFIDCYVSEIHDDHFIVKSETVKEGRFFWHLSAIRKGFSDVKLERADNIVQWDVKTRLERLKRR